MSQSSLATRSSALRVRDLTKSFGATPVLRGFALDLADREFVALLGRSGEGKSTFLRIAEGLDTDYDGEVRVATRRSVVFQEPRLLPWARVWENVVLGLEGRAGDLRSIAEAALAEVGLAEKAEVWPVTLSGGEAQRVGLARAFVRDPRLLLLDEPFGALDALTRLRMHGLLRDLISRHGPGVVLVTHDVQEALDLADRVLVLSGGRLVLDEPVPRSGPAGRSGPGVPSGPVEDLRLRILATLGVVRHDGTPEPEPRAEASSQERG